MTTRELTGKERRKIRKLVAVSYTHLYGSNTAVGNAAGSVTIEAVSKNYSGSKTINFDIEKSSAPALTFPTASGLTYGQKLNESKLTGGTSGRGAFIWKESNAVPLAGKQAYAVVFLSLIHI